MIGTLPVTSLPPLEYRWALDAAMPLFSRSGLSHLVCHVPALQIEINQRLSGLVSCSQPGNGLWVEPLLDSWREEIHEFSAQIKAGGTLAVMASCPAARWLPERQGWTGDPLGLRLWGFLNLHSGLCRTGFHRIYVYGMHSPVSILLNYCASQVERHGFPEMADRIRFSARYHYVQRGLFWMLGTVALFLYQKSL